MKKNRATSTTQNTKKRGRVKENLVNKTVGVWIVRREYQDDTFICEHRVSGQAKIVKRSALLVSRHYTKLRDFYVFAQEYITSHKH